MEITPNKKSSISWSAIWAGALAGVGINFLLNLFSLSMGLASFAVHSDGQTTLTIAGFTWFLISALLAMFSTGWIAGKLTPYVLPRVWGILHGFLAWSLLLVLTIILITNFIQYSAFHSNFTSNLVAIKLTHDAPMLTETKAHNIKNSSLSFNVETHKKIITLNASLTLLLFFIGAMASCLGGWVGYKSKPRSRRQ